MTIVAVLLLLVAAASTIAFSPPDELQQPFGGHDIVPRAIHIEEPRLRFLVRRRRDIPAASKSGASAGSFSSSSSGSGSGSGTGYGFSSRSGPVGDAGGFNGVGFPGANDYANNIPNFGFGSPYHNPYAGAGYVPVDFNALFQQYILFMQRVAQQQAGYTPNDISSRSGFAGPDNFGGFGYPGATNFAGGAPSDGSQVSASAVANLSPRGGFGSASISPPPEGNFELGTRMGILPPSDGSNFGVFTSSSSGSSDLNGVKKSFKEATSVVNDNGKVTTYHVSDP